MAYRLVHPSGGTVDYWDEQSAKKQQKRVPGAKVVKVNVRTGKEVT